MDTSSDSDPGTPPSSIYPGSYAQTESTSSPNTTLRRSKYAVGDLIIAGLIGALLAGPVWWWMDLSMYTSDDQARGAEYRKSMNFNRDQRTTDSEKAQCTAIAGTFTWGTYTDPQAFAPAGQAFWEACTGIPIEVAF